jgi:hypothetical protein
MTLPLVGPLLDNKNSSLILLVMDSVLALIAIDVVSEGD